MTPARPPKADMQKALDAFVTASDAPALDVVDRSTLERYAVCPAQAVLCERGAVNTGSAIASAGEEGWHKAASATTAEYVSAGGNLSPSDLADIMGQHLRAARPDVQPEAIRGGRASVWPWAKWLASLHPNNILAFDGGECVDKPGQMAWDIPHLNIRVTSELDMLTSGPSPKVLHEYDYKTGHTEWRTGDVYDSFQFQLHAWLVLNAYEDVDCLEVTVWDTRRNRRTYPVQFERKHLPNWNARILSAAGERARADWPRREPECWPESHKCSICPAAAACPEVGLDATELVDNPEGYVERLVALDARLTAMRKLAAAYVDEHGDIVLDSGDAFGRCKPRGERKAPATIYQVSTETLADDA